MTILYTYNYRMPKSLAAVLCCLIAAVCLTAGCGAAPTASNNANSAAAANSGALSGNSNTAKDNVDELGLLVNLAIPPQEVVWKETTANTPPGRRLFAVLRYDPADTGKVVAQASRHRPPTPESMSAEDWFPAELIAQGDISGESKLNGQSYAANDFLIPPFTTGKLLRIENTDYFILEVDSN